MSTIKQKSVVVQYGDDKKIEVRRMKWKSTRQLIKMLGDIIAKLYADDGSQKNAVVDAATVADAAKGFIARVGAIIGQSDELVEALVLASTDLNAQEFGELDIATASEVIAQAFAINFDAELKNSWGSVVGVVQALTLPKAKTN